LITLSRTGSGFLAALTMPNFKGDVFSFGPIFGQSTPQSTRYVRFSHNYDFRPTVVTNSWSDLAGVSGAKSATASAKDTRQRSD